MKNVFHDLEEYVCARLSACDALSACQFIPENERTVEYEIKKNLGKQGIVGLVQVPKARFAGRAGDVGNAWTAEIEIDVVENPTVNRGRPLSSYCTAMDAAYYASEVLCPCEGEKEGLFNLVSFEHGEDGGLVVAKVTLQALVLPENPRLTVIKGRGRAWKVTAEELTKEAVEAAGVTLSDVLSVQCAEGVRRIGDAAFLSCPSIEHLSFAGQEIGAAAFRGCSSLTGAVFGPALSSLGDRAFCFDAALTSAVFAGDPPEVGQRGFYGCYDLSAYVPKVTQEWEAWGREQEIPVLPLSGFQS